MNYTWRWEREEGQRKERDRQDTSPGAQYPAKLCSSCFILMPVGTWFPVHSPQIKRSQKQLPVPSIPSKQGCSCPPSSHHLQQCSLHRFTAALKPCSSRCSSMKAPEIRVMFCLHTALADSS